MIKLSSNQVKFCICCCSIFPCYLWPDLNFKPSSFCNLILAVTLILPVDWISNSRAVIFFYQTIKTFSVQQASTSLSSNVRQQKEEKDFAFSHILCASNPHGFA